VVKEGRRGGEPTTTVQVTLCGYYNLSIRLNIA
jgi:hypothetical protein